MSDDITTDHVYDGISEHDNRLPAWWLFTLYGAIVFAVGYWSYYHLFAAGTLPRAQLKEDVAVLDAQIAAAEAARPGLDDAALETLSHDAAVVERGRAVFGTTCFPCHGAKGEGTVGPNLTDASWIHGGKPSEIYKTVSEGFVQKGMPAWKPALGGDKVRDVTAFVLTLRNTNVPGKAPEGVAAP